MEMDLNVLMFYIAWYVACNFCWIHSAGIRCYSMIGTYFIFEDAYMAASQVGGAAYELIRDHVFMTIPHLFNG